MSDSEFVDETLFEQWMAAKERDAAEYRRRQAEAEERRSGDPVLAAAQKHRVEALSHRSTAAFFQRQADDETNPRRRAAHQQDADTFLRRAQEAEAQAARATPAEQQRALITSNVEKAS